jgi:HAD superfamily hydrolase (TIGR01457 family)
MEPLSQVRCFLLDMDGTFYLGDRLLNGALRFIEVLENQGKDFLFLTNNSSKHARQYAEKITRLGLPVNETKVLTSGEATARYLNGRQPGAKLYVAGTPALIEEFYRHGFVIEEEAPDLVVLGFDTTLTYQKLWKLCDLVRSGLPYIATHADFNCPTETGFMPDVGAIIAFIKASTGREPDLVVGKPNRLIVLSAAEKVGWAVEKLAMIGDRLYTDIALGKTSGIPTVLVLSGETRRFDLEGSPHRPDYVFADLGEAASWLLEHGQPGEEAAS